MITETNRIMCYCVIPKKKRKKRKPRIFVEARSWARGSGAEPTWFDLGGARQLKVGSVCHWRYCPDTKCGQCCKRLPTRRLMTVILSAGVCLLYSAFGKLL